MALTAAPVRAARATFIGASIALAFTSAPVTVGLTCGETGETPGVIESVLDGTHGRSDRWEIIAAGTVTTVEPLDGAYNEHGAWIEMDVAYWFRGPADQWSLRFFDPPAGGSGVGFEIGAQYLVLATEDAGWGGRLATGACELSHRLPDMERIERLASVYGAQMPDTALPIPTRSASTALGVIALFLVAVVAGPILARAFRNG